MPDPSTNPNWAVPMRASSDSTTVLVFYVIEGIYLLLYTVALFVIIRSSGFIDILDRDTFPTDRTCRPS
jgi:hypothetical protein